MKQLLQDVSSGDISVQDVPAPMRDQHSLLVETAFSVISPGTERAVMQIGQASLVGKARARPDLVRKVVDSAREEGVVTAFEKVRGRLGMPNPLGYSLTGTVVEACDGAPAAPGERVACAGAGLASHAEVVSVPRNLCARVPEGVQAEDAAYATVASIALHGMRLCGVGLGDVCAVIGLGLLGQLELDLLHAAGCVPLGLDLDPRRVELARGHGYFATTDASDLEAEARRLTAGRGADAALVTAASKSAAPLATAISVAREQAVVSVVGDVALESPRAPLFEKELRVVVSRSYGPGRYDPVYERDGIDYPAGYVRWTEGRNMDEVLRLMGTGQLRPSRLTTHTFELDDGPSAYELLEADEPSMGILLRYPGGADLDSRSVDVPREGLRKKLAGARTRPVMGVVGAGQFARSVLIPALGGRADIRAVAAATGASARSTAERVGATTATTDAHEVLTSADLDAVVIATPHGSHAAYVTEALEAGKHVFVEKPLAIDEDGLARVEHAAADSAGVLMVGFNRRFAPLTQALREALSGRGPLVMTCRVNAGRLPEGHWTHHPELGGGRIVGEMCHFVDLLSYLAGSPPHLLSAAAVGGGSEPREDNVCATLGFADGSVGQIVYSAFGDSSLPKERIEVLGEVGAGALSDFRELKLHRGGQSETASRRRDKGHGAELRCFVEACRSGRQPWPASDMVAVMRATFAIRDAVQASPAAATT